MTEHHFHSQMNRIKATYGKNAYPDERVTILWNACRSSVPDTAFEEAVSDLIANHRSAPMLKDFLEAINEANARVHERKVRESYNYQTAMGMVEYAAKVNKKADPEYVQVCLKLLRDRLDGKISFEQFLQGCDYLDSTARAMRG